MSNNNGPFRKFTQFFTIKPDKTTGKCYAFKDEFKFVDEAEDEPAHELFIGGIRYSVKKEQLKEHFGKYGEVKYVKLKRGYKKPNYGCVGFKDAKSVKKVLENLVSLQNVFIYFLIALRYHVITTII